MCIQTPHILCSCVFVYLNAAFIVYLRICVFNCTYIICSRLGFSAVGFSLLEVFPLVVTFSKNTCFSFSFEKIFCHCHQVQPNCFLCVLKLFPSLSFSTVFIAIFPPIVFTTTVVTRLGWIFCHPLSLWGCRPRRHCLFPRCLRFCILYLGVFWYLGWCIIHLSSLTLSQVFEILYIVFFGSWGGVLYICLFPR